MRATTITVHEKIDLLVDGELDPQQRAELLSSVEETEGGWRHCALAFLESQTIGEAIGARGAGRPARSAAWLKLTGMAAALAAAFFAGRSLEGQAVPEASLQTQAEPVAAEPTRPDIDRGPVFQPVVLDGRPAYTTLESVPAFMLQALVAAGHRVRHVERVVHLDSEAGEPIELPLLETHIVDMRPRAL